jgi:glycosyltransferase involved in cell wall biosynthesis
MLLVGPLPPPSGGMANQTRQLSELLTQEGLDVRIVQTNAPYRPAWAEKLPVVRALFRLVPYLWRLWRDSRTAQVAHVMANSGWAWFLCAAPAIQIAKWRGVPVVVNYRGGLAREFLAARSRWVLPTLRKAHRLVVPSGFLREVFAAYGVEAQVIPNVVNVERFSPQGVAITRPRLDHVVVARNLESIYGIDLAIQALAILKIRVPTAHMTIAGSGIERAKLEAQMRAAGLSDAIKFSGRLEVEQMAALYREADVVLNPSRVDNTPNSILEALSCGVPVVSTDVGGVSFLVAHERTAILVAPENPDAIAAGVARVLGDAALRERLRIEGLALARACSWPEVKQLWLEAYLGLAIPGPALSA